jgi:CDP-6-deoxy-D-xylo-4-hexulose-3-dehydrase
MRNKVEDALQKTGVEFRRGMSGGGNQLRQPYLRNLFPEYEYRKYFNCEHVHHFGWYIGNYPELDPDNIDELCKIVNAL